jgi:superfamily II DNA or RNA helicase
MPININKVAKFAGGAGLTKFLIDGKIPESKKKNWKPPTTAKMHLKSRSESMLTEVETELPPSFSFLSKESVKLFTKYKAKAHERIALSMSKDGRFLTRIAGGWDMKYSWPSSLPEKQKVTLNGDDAWLMPPTDTFALAVMLAWNDDQIDFNDAGSVTKMQLLRAQLELGNQIARVNARWKLHGQIPDHEMFYNESIPPTPYQEVAAFCSLKSEGFALTMKQGTGKTSVIIQTMCNECEEIQAREGRMYRALIVVPNAVRLNWQVEIERFSTKKLRTTVIRGDHLTRVKQLCNAFRKGDEVGTVVIVGIDTLVAAWPIFEIFDWDLAAIDESHLIKNGSTKRAKVCLQLRDKARKRMIATGTPVANSILDIYTQLEFLGKGYSGFHSWKSFSKFYGKYRYDPSQGDLLVGDNLNVLPILQERLARMSFSITLEEAMPHLPKKTYDIIEVEMTKEQSELYKKVAQQVEIEIRNEMERAEQSDTINKTLVVNNILTLLLKLSQVTSGFLNFPQIADEHGNVSQEKHTYVLDKNPKIDAIVEVLKAKKPNEKTLLWACYTQDVHAIYDALVAAGIDGVSYFGDTTERDREAAVIRYNTDPTCRFFVGNAGAGGVGLNLLGYPTHTKDPETYTTQAIYFSQGWSYILRDQSEARGHRMGTLHPVQITDIVVPGTIDEEIRARVMEKKVMATSVADLKPLLTRILGV